MKRRRNGGLVRQNIDHVHAIMPTTFYLLAEEAQKSVSGMGENAVHGKYIELVSRVSRHV